MITVQARMLSRAGGHYACFDQDNSLDHDCPTEMGHMVTWLSWVMLCKEVVSISQMPFVVKDYLPHLPLVFLFSQMSHIVIYGSSRYRHNLHCSAALTSLPGRPGLGSLLLWCSLQGSPHHPECAAYRARAIGQHHCTGSGKSEVTAPTLGSTPLEMYGWKEFTFLLWASVFPSVAWEKWWNLLKLSFGFAVRTSSRSAW